jgi:hypothetical protein
VSATRLIQTAIYAVLAADSTLAGLSSTRDDNGVLTTVTVHNDVPEGKAYPHVLIARATEMPRHVLGGASTGLGWKNIIRIHVYSRYAGDIEVLNIWERIVSLLNFQTLTITGYTSVLTKVESMRVLIEAIEKIETRHLVGELNVTVQQ